MHIAFAIAGAEAGAELGGMNETCEERRLIASRAVHSGMQCQATKPRPEFWGADWPHRDQGPGIRCKSCEPHAPQDRGVGQGHLCDALWKRNEERKLQSLKCSTCGVEQARERFWPMDIRNRLKKGRLSCKACEPTPPNERRKRPRDED